MEIKIDARNKLVEVWQTHADQNDAALQAQLKSMYADWKKQKFLVAVFRSGREDLYTNTRDLLAYNKRRAGELAVQREKQALLRAQ